MSCPRENEVLEHFTASSLDQIASHLAECDPCRALVADLEATTRRLAPDPGEFDDPELARDVLTLIKLNKTPAKKQRRWSYSAVPIAALAAGLSLFFLRPQDRDEDQFQARSGTNLAPDRWVSIEIYRARDGETGYQRVEGDIRTDDALLFTLNHRPESPYRYAMIFAFDDRGQIYWYYPAYTDAAEDPVSIAAPPSQKPISLPEAVRHPLEPGWLRVVGLFSKSPLDVKSVEAIVGRAINDRGSSKDVARLPTSDETGQHSFLLRVEAR